MDLSVSIFSFNRGNYVRNCVDSLMRCYVGGSFKVFDDSSDDLETLEYLQSLGGRVVSCGQGDKGRHGGLYNNMQRALEQAETKYILFLQDDTQFVRQLDQKDFDGIDIFFEANPNAAFLNPVFLKGHRRKSIKKQVELKPEFEGYFHNISESLKPRPVSMYYCDVVIAHVERLRNVNWRFLDSETSNAELARSHFSKMLQMANPFIMHVPEVPVFRGKKTTLGSRLSTRLVGSDVKQFEYMAEDEVACMRSRNLDDQLPFAEDFLQTKNKKVGRPFRYNAVSTRLYTRLLHKIEQSFRG